MTVTSLIESSTAAIDQSKGTVYETPRLIVLGDVRDLTLGGSVGSGDSGNPGLEEF